MMKATPILLMCFMVSIAEVSSDPLSEAEKQEFLRLHNQARRGVSDASNMMELEWDDVLERDAQRYANTCPSGPSQQSGQGENLAWEWPSRTVADVMNSWVNNERGYFNYYLHNFCTGGLSNCGHFSQVIWAKTSRLGCARRTECKGMRTYPKLDGVVYVCRYTTKGNINGQRAYLRGAKCSDCSSEYSTCNYGLCSSSAGSSWSDSSASGSWSSGSPSYGSTTETLTCPSGKELAADTRADGLFDQECVFPFRYRGVVYSGCTNRDWNKPWCALKVSSISRQVVIGRWGNCECIDSHCSAGRSLIADTRGNKEYFNDCVFPFVYDGREYRTCTRVDYSKLWCPLETDSNGETVPGQWGVCGCFRNRYSTNVIYFP